MCLLPSVTMEEMIPPALAARIDARQLVRLILPIGARCVHAESGMLTKDIAFGEEVVTDWPE